MAGHWTNKLYLWETVWPSRRGQIGGGGRGAPTSPWNLRHVCYHTGHSGQHDVPSKLATSVANPGDQIYLFTTRPQDKLVHAAQWLAERPVPDVHSLGTLKVRGDDRQLVASSFSERSPISSDVQANNIISSDIQANNIVVPRKLNRLFSRKSYRCQESRRNCGTSTTI